MSYKLYLELTNFRNTIFFFVAILFFCSEFLNSKLHFLHTNDTNLYADLRGCLCLEDWTFAKSDSSVCNCSYDQQGQRDNRCPSYVSPVYLAAARYHAECQTHHADISCAVQCDGVNSPVVWVPIRTSNQQNKKKQKIKYELKNNSLANWPCRQESNLGYFAKHRSLLNFSVGIVTHEIVAFSASLHTFEQRGFFSLLGEVIIYMNRPSSVLNESLVQFQKRWPGLFVVLLAPSINDFESGNSPMATCITRMAQIARFRYFLLLERDFQLTEPDTCVEEQLTAGANLLDTGGAVVVRMRSRKSPGIPNYVNYLFKGKEHLAFVQHPQDSPRWACNVYFWTENAQVVYPDAFSNCASNHDLFLCSNSFFCDWTNNPVLFHVDWWLRNYAVLANDDPVDLEYLMNAERWSKHRWPVALPLLGLFTHMDDVKWKPLCEKNPELCIL